MMNMAMYECGDKEMDSRDAERIVLIRPAVSAAERILRVQDEDDSSRKRKDSFSLLINLNLILFHYGQSLCMRFGRDACASIGIHSDGNLRQKGFGDQSI